MTDIKYKSRDKDPNGNVCQKMQCECHGKVLLYSVWWGGFVCQSQRNW